MVQVSKLGGSKTPAATNVSDRVAKLRNMANREST